MKIDTLVVRYLYNAVIKFYILKNLLLIVFSLALLQSCNPIYFVDPQPKNGILLTEVPKELQGVWNDQGKIVVNNQSFRVKNSKDEIEDEWILSDSIRLFKLRDLYVLNTRQADTDWEITIIERNRKGDVSFYQTTDTNFFVKDKNLKLKEAYFIIDEEYTKVHSLNLCDSEGRIMEFQSATFSGKMRYKTLKNIINEKNLWIKLKSDGTIYTPDRSLKN